MFPQRSFSLVIATLLVGASALAIPAAAPAQSAPVFGDSVSVVPGPQFSTTSWVRWLGTPLFGSRYRTLWDTPLTLPTLDTRATGGGLRRTGMGTGSDSGLVYLVGRDGSRWTYMPIARTDPRELYAGVAPKSVSDGFVADLASGRLPVGPLLAATLAEAAGVPSQPAWLVALRPGSGVLPPPAGDSLQVGYLLLADPVAVPDSTTPPREGEVVTARAMLHRALNQPGTRIDERAVLAASLFNVYVGNLAPSFLSWRWRAEAGADGTVWRPLGLFRETAFTRYDGIAAYLARPIQPDLAVFGGRYPRLLTGVPDQASAYRYLLGALPRPVWDSAGAALRARLTDSVIDAAIARMPEAYREAIGSRLAAALRDRRDRLPTAVSRMYASVRGKAEVQGTSASDAVAVSWPARDTLALGLGGRTVTFDAEGTSRVTLLLGAGTDTVQFSGPPGRRPRLQVASPPGDTVVVQGDPGESPVEIAGKPVVVETPPGVRVRQTSAEVRNNLVHLDTTGTERTEGHRSFSPTGWFEITSGVGVLLGGGVVRTDWSGEARPYRNRVKLRAAYGSESGKGVVQLLGDFRFAGSPLRVNLEAIASGVGAVYFYGFGNDTPGDSSSGYYRAGRNLYGLSGSLVVPLSDMVRLSGGFVLKSVATPLDTTLFIGLDQPYGSPAFGEGGITGTASYDSRDVRGAPHRGVYAEVVGAWYPLIRDGSGAFGTLTGSVAGYHTPGWWPAMTVAARVGGTATFGEVPYFEAAFVGGGRTLRGLPQGRYEGNQSIYGNLDLRLRVSRVQFVLPWDFGVLGLADLGRVFVTGESSTTWHPTIGGGLWVALLDRSLAASLNVASGAGQGTFLNLSGGFTF